METSVLGGCACDELWARGGQGESGLGSSVIVGSLSNSRVTTYGRADADTHFLQPAGGKANAYTEQKGQTRMCARARVCFAYLSSLLEALNSLLVSHALQVNSINLQQSVTCHMDTHKSHHH